MMRNVKLPVYLEKSSTVELFDDTYHQGVSYTDENVDETIDNHTYEDCAFDHISFQENVEDSLFVNVKFSHCDFSNISCQRNVFRTCQFDHCRLMGVDFVDASFQDVIFDGCSLQYSNCSATKWKNGVIQNTVCSSTTWNGVRKTNLKFDKCDLRETEWLDTKLDGLDFSNSQIDGMQVSVHDIQGLIVNDVQAVEFAKLFGLVVK